MIISDLNYMEAVDADVQGASGVNFVTNVKKDVDINKYINVDIDKYVDSHVKISGNLGAAEASANAYGDNTLAETETFAQATDHSSEAFSDSVAAVY